MKAWPHRARPRARFRDAIDFAQVHFNRGDHTQSANSQKRTQTAHFGKCKKKRERGRDFGVVRAWLIASPCQSNTVQLRFFPKTQVWDKPPKSLKICCDGANLTRQHRRGTTVERCQKQVIIMLVTWDAAFLFFVYFESSAEKERSVHSQNTHQSSRNKNVPIFCWMWRPGTMPASWRHTSSLWRHDAFGAKFAQFTRLCEIHGTETRFVWAFTMHSLSNWNFFSVKKNPKKRKETLTLKETWHFTMTESLVQTRHRREF